MEKSTTIGKTNNFLAVIGEETRNGRKYVVCQCECGKVKSVQYGSWSSGKVKSCGCKRIELLSKAAIKHGESTIKPRLYRIWHGMITRCYSKNANNYSRYGAKGISVCEEWRGEHGYENFKEWALKNGYAENLTIDRRDGKGNYEPDNCRWATYHEQNLNREVKKRKYWEIDGVTKARSDWCKEYGKSVQCVMYRVEKMGMTPKEALMA